MGTRRVVSRIARECLGALVPDGLHNLGVLAAFHGRADLRREDGERDGPGD